MIPLILLNYENSRIIHSSKEGWLVIGKNICKHKPIKLYRNIFRAKVISHKTKHREPLSRGMAYHIHSLFNLSNKAESKEVRPSSCKDCAQQENKNIETSRFEMLTTVLEMKTMRAKNS